MSAELNPDPTKGAKERNQQVILPGPCDVFLDIDKQIRVLHAELCATYNLPEDG